MEPMGIISRATIVVPHIRGLTTPFTTTREPPSSCLWAGLLVLKVWDIWPTTVVKT